MNLLPIPTGRRSARAVIVHGYRASVRAHWFPAVAAELGAQGLETTIVELPVSTHPDPKAWTDAVRTAISGIDKTGGIDQDLFIIAHSLGVVTTLEVLDDLLSTNSPSTPDASGTDASGTETAPPPALGGIVLVSGFVQPLGALPELDGYLDRLEVARRPGAVEGLVPRMPHRLVIRSDDDGFVPADLTDDLADRLDAPVAVIPGAGHFLASDGIRDLPVVSDWIRAVRASAGMHGAAH